MTLQLLHDPISGWARTPHDEFLPPASVEALVRQLDRGRRARVASPAQRALLGRLDGERCRFPSCTHTRHLNAHHVRFWSDGGPTDLPNLALICSRHHKLIHDNGYQLTLASDRSLTVRTADGVPVLHRPELPHAPAEDLPQVAALPSQWGGERMDLGYVVNVLTQHAA